MESSKRWKDLLDSERKLLEQDQAIFTEGVDMLNTRKRNERRALRRLDEWYLAVLKRKRSVADA